MISAIIPTYRAPKYLDLCLKSATENKVSDETEIIVIVDGYVEESEEILKKYEGSVSVLPLQENMGMQAALNLGVMNATNEYIFILNDDNVFPTRWDVRMKDAIPSNKTAVVTMNQVEPSPSIFDFVISDLGRNADEFRYEEWLAFEKQLDTNTAPDGRGRIFPFIISKRLYMAVGGFDTFYASPFWCDVDFWLKLELLGNVEFERSRKAHFYHFGSASTKNREDSEAAIFKRSEGAAAEAFHYKWGYLPNIVRNAHIRENTKMPDSPQTIKGITYDLYSGDNR